MTEAASRPPGTAAALAALCEPATIRLRARAIAQAVDAGASPHFRLDRDRLDAAALRVAALTRRRFPALEIPYHSRWRHFAAGGVDRIAALDARLAALPAEEALRARVDLVVVSVLLDAGAGPAWRYREDGREFARSEGLAVASLHAFAGGRFSSDAARPLRVDAAALAALDADALASVFQAGAANPLVGLDGRAALLRRLGALLQQRAGAGARPSLLVDRVAAESESAGAVDAGALLGRVLAEFAPIWTGGSEYGGVLLGDCWRHPHAGDATARGPDAASAGWVPFHKLSQWLTYSLLEPFEQAGFAVAGLESLTGLPEYRNGGLLVDAGVVVPRDAAACGRRWRPGDEFVVEWRALTVALLDELALRVRAQLGASTAELPLARILEGGTWAAGRELAAERRPGGEPPFALDSDGTIF